MENDGRIRASDADREKAVEILRGAYTEGRLTLEEFDERTTAAYEARTWSALRELTSDLPVGVALGPVPERPDLPLELVPGSGELRPPVRRGFPLPLLPIILLMILASGGHALTLIPAAVVVIVFLRLITRHRPNGPDHRSGGSSPRPGGGPV